MTDDPLARARALGEQLRALVDRGADAELVSHARRRATEHDPALFAVVYLAHHLRDAFGAITFAPLHLSWAASAQRWAQPAPEPMDSRRAEVAPREMGKSTWWFLLLPMWAAAHGHVRFAAAFADSSTQAETHLATFKRELDTNALLRADYPDLVEPYRRGRGQTEADRVSLYHARSGFAFAAAGMDGSNLGLKIGERRPDLLILDDVEPHEAKYSAQLAAKRLSTLRQAILPLNVRAHVILVGTVTMHGSIVHQIVRYARGERDDPDDAASNAWVGDERITARHTVAIVEHDDGTRSSAWPAKWSLEFLQSIEHTRAYLLNYANDPIGADGDYWQPDDFHREHLDVARVLLSIDPAVTSRDSSDFTGLAVLGFDPVSRRCSVLGAWQVKLDPDALRKRVLSIVAEHDVGRVLVETNQGGDLWPRMLRGVPVKIVTVHQTIRKEVRAASVLDYYQAGRVLHEPTAQLAALEGQMVAFPRAPHDDMVDAVGSGVRYLLDRTKRVRAGIEVEQYA